MLSIIHSLVIPRKIVTIMLPNNIYSHEHVVKMGYSSIQQPHPVDKLKPCRMNKWQHLGLFSAHYICATWYATQILF